MLAIDEVGPAAEHDDRNANLLLSEHLGDAQPIALRPRISLDRVVEEKHVDLFLSHDFVEAVRRHGVNRVPPALLRDTTDDFTNRSLVIDN